MRAAPDWAERAKRRRWTSLAGILVGAALVVFSLSTRVRRPQGGFTTPFIGFVAAAAGAIIVVVTIVYVAAAAGASTRIDRRLRILWTGPVGRRLFGMVSRRAARTRPAAQVVSAEMGPLTLMDELPKDVRRDLGEVARVISSLVAAQKDLVEREARLSSSQLEATRGSSGAAADTLDRVVTELSEAKQAATQKRDDITAALERIRLELIRLRSGVGSAADVNREAAKAGSLLAP